MESAICIYIHLFPEHFSLKSVIMLLHVLFILGIGALLGKHVSNTAMQMRSIAIWMHNDAYGCITMHTNTYMVHTQIYVYIYTYIYIHICQRPINP